jgi:hypothetical protein
MNARRSDPWIPIGHPDFKWTSGSDVQALWRKYGWVPPSEQRQTPLPEMTKEPEWITARRKQ